MRIIRSTAHPRYAIVRMGRMDDYGGRHEADGPDLFAAQQWAHRMATRFCVTHDLRGYTIYACADAGGSTLDEVEL